MLVVLNRDLFFGVKIANVMRGLGYRVELAQRTTVFAVKLDASGQDVALGIIDIGAGVDWNVISSLSASVPILAFGSHLDVDGMRAAKLAGVSRVVSNGDFHREMVTLVQRYARAQSGRTATENEAPS